MEDRVHIGPDHASEDDEVEKFSGRHLPRISCVQVSREKVLSMEKTLGQYMGKEWSATDSFLSDSTKLSWLHFELPGFM